ncbi:unnamed protein product [Rhizoctonia solani]|uniref:Uncharacterized protein n=1 Tax=Rhizoctonia solani TaxID=456999 RepID=A0A8H2WKI1_9AGAM|nr:unnamed protein product [Rhizoctonia solani]
MVEVLPLTPTTPPQIRQHPYADARHSISSSEDSEDSSEEEVGIRTPRVVVDGVESEASGSGTRSMSMSPRSTRTTNTSATDESSVQIVRAQRIHRARAHSHSIDEIRQLLSPPPDSTFHRSLPPPLQIQPPVLGNNGTLRALPNEAHILSPGTPGSASQLTPRSLSPASPNPPPALPPRSSARRRPRIIVKEMGALLEHINEDELDSHARLNSLVRTTRSVSLPGIARQSSDSDPNMVSLPPPPRPRNRALVRTVSAAVHDHALFGTPMDSRSVSIQRPQTQPAPTLALQPPPRRSSLSGICESPPPTPPPKDRKYVPVVKIPPPPRRESLDQHRSSLYSLPLTPVGIPLPPSTVTPNFPQSPQSTVFHTTHVDSPPTTPQRASFLPSCKATSVHSSAIVREDWPSPRPSEDRSNRLSTLSNPFGDFSFLRPLPNNRVSGISFSSNVSGFSARSATEAESIPIGLHRATSQDADRDDLLLPVSPRSSWLRSGFEVDVHLPGAYEDGEDDESVTEESSEKSSILDGRERSKSVTLPYIPSASFKKAARVLGISGGPLLYQHAHAPHLSSPSPMSSSPENPTPTTITAGAEPVQQSFLPSTAPPSAFSMGGLGRRLSKRSSPSSLERRRSEDVARASSQPSGGLMARMDRFMGRTPSPAGRTRELESEDELPSPPPILTFPKPTHGRKHSSSDPSAGLASTNLTGRPSTSNMRTAAERAELVKKARKIQQVLGDVPPVSGTTGSAFYRVSRAARSEDSLVTPTSGRGEVVLIGGSADVRGHRSTASLSSRPLLALSPALQTDGLLDIRTSGSGDDFRVSLNEGVKPEADDVDLEEHERDEDEDESALARRAKRVKVAKLNRYLGSRVPAHLVLGMNEETWDYEQGLPRAQSEDGESGSVLSGKKRRASDGDYASLEEGMNDLSVMSTEEKARAVRRKAKMEKMFGERPPQKLYQVQSGADGPSKSVSDHESEPEDEEDEKSLEGAEGGAHYQSYRASFNSLAYFVSNADRDSLEGLYDIISGPSESDSVAQRNQFAARRKRAAKLSNFFGVSYRDLFGAVLDILESDVKEDKEEGSLSAAETQDLLRKLKSLKDKGQGISV